MYDQPSTAGFRFGRGLFAFLAVLAIAAGSAGYFGARSVLAAADSPTAAGSGGPAGGNPASGPATRTGPTAGHGAGSSGSGSSSGGNDGSGPAGGTHTGPTQTTSRPTTPPDQVPAGDPSRCPQPTVDALAHAGLDSTLTVLLYIRVHRDFEYDSEVWVCQNSAGLLAYQGHVLRRPLDVATSDHTLLVVEGINGEVVAGSGGSYLATNPVAGGKSTEYHVSRTALVIVDEPGDQNRQEYPVIVAKP